VHCIESFFFNFPEMSSTTDRKFCHSTLDLLSPQNKFIATFDQMNTDSNNHKGTHFLMMFTQCFFSASQNNEIQF